MSESLAVVPPPNPSQAAPNRFEGLRASVLNAVASVHSKRNYAKALDELQAFCVDRQASISRALLMEFRAAMLERELSLPPSTSSSPRSDA